MRDPAVSLGAMMLLVLTLLQVIPIVPPDALGRREGLPHVGVIYDAAASSAEAMADLSSIRAIGANAVLMGLEPRDEVLAWADSLGLSLFQMLPLYGLSAEHYIEKASEQRSILEGALERARRHPGARHFGVAWNVDTSDPRACGAIADLADIVRRAGIPGAQVFYITVFSGSDQCGGEVDFVLLDTTSDEDPARRLAAWRSTRTVDVGLGGLGTWVASSSGSGYKVRHSPEYQARYLETHIRKAMHGGLGPLRALFVERWKDDRVSYPSFDADLRRPYVRPQGLLTEDGASRPALDVVAGLYTGRQEVFAFQAGRPREAPRAMWHRWLGWMVVAALALLFRMSYLVATNARRYFFSHGFYIEMIGTGRQVSLAPQLTIVLVLSAAAAVLAGIAMDVLVPLPAFSLISSGFAPGVQQALVRTVQAPWVLFITAATVYAGLLLGWAILLTVLAGLRRRLTAAQRIALVVWPRWPLIPIMVGGLVADTLPDPYRIRGVSFLLFLWVASDFWSTMRMIEDFVRAARTSRLPAYLLGAAIPSAALVTLAILVVRGSGIPVLEFAWHLLTRP
jgi:hypothetical protein